MKITHPFIKFSSMLLLTFALSLDDQEPIETPTPIPEDMPTAEEYATPEATPEATPTPSDESPYPSQETQEDGISEDEDPYSY